MAERRMFAKSIIGSARFLRMPPTSRLLYYDLGMAADDDGVVEAFSVMRTTGANEDDLRVLASKGFVRVLNEDLVTYISDWSRNNYIQKDRYHPSIYTELLVRLSADASMDTDCIQDVSKMDTQSSLGQSSLGQVRVGQSSLVPTLEEVQAYCLERKNNINPEQFMDHYQANGWMVSGSPMRDWKAVIRKWENTEKERSGRSTGPKPSSDPLAGFHTEDEES